MFSDPSVNEDLVAFEVRDDWNAKTGTLEEWVAAFQAVDNADNVAATIEDIKEEASLLIKAEKFRTPLKKRREEDIEWEDDTLGEMVFGNHVRTLPMDDFAEMEAMIANRTLERGMLTKLVARVESSVITQGAVIGAVAVLTHK